MLTMVCLMTFLGAGLVGWILLGLEDEGHWRNCKAPRMLEVNVSMPVMFSTRPKIGTPAPEATA